MNDNLPTVDEEKCSDCGVCVLKCPSQARSIVELLHMFT